MNEVEQNEDGHWQFKKLTEGDKMTDLKTLIDSKIERNAEKYGEEFKVYPKLYDRSDFYAGANSMKDHCLKLLEALEFECGNRCATGINPCNAREAIENFKREMEE